MQITSVHNDWQDNVFKIDINLGNYCNYKCWYCWPDSNTGTQKFPDIELIKTNITHLINYIKNNSNKTVFDIHFNGGEPSHWPKLIEFIKYLKDNFNCLISMTSNGSKKLEWWEKAWSYFDRIHFSCHHEYVELEHFRDVCDLVFEKGVAPSVSVMMDPKAWDKCVDIVEYLTNSKFQWSIRYESIIHESTGYTNEQLSLLSKHRARMFDPLWIKQYNKYHIGKIAVTDTAGNKHIVHDNELQIRNLNKFYGWECSVGVNWITVDKFGQISGTCQQLLYGELEKYNLYDTKFSEKFLPKLEPAICDRLFCNCNPEISMPKINKRVISIYEN